jgi:enoyl-CoA hydratase/carnithine racemase
VSDDAPILVERADEGVALVWLDRPERGNAFTVLMQAELHRAFIDLEADDSVRCVVVTGRGRFFSTGADLGSGGDTFTNAEEELNAQRRMMVDRVRPWNLRTPIVAAMNGAAVGVGLTFPLQWDIRVMAEDAKYGFVFNRRGVMPEANSLWLLPRLVGASRAIELLLTGRLFLGREAAEIGLAAAAVPADEVLATALEIARQIAVNTAPLSTSITKLLIYEMLSESSREETYNREWETFKWLGSQSDAAEGVGAFLEKRDPAWTMSKNDPLPNVGPTWTAFGDE